MTCYVTHKPELAGLFKSVTKIKIKLCLYTRPGLGAGKISAAQGKNPECAFIKYSRYFH